MTDWGWALVALLVVLALAALGALALICYAAMWWRRIMKGFPWMG